MSASPPSVLPAAASFAGRIGADSSWFWRLAGGALIVVIVVGAYWPALRGEFLLDDRLLVSESPIIQSSNGLYRFWFTTEPTDYWPVTNTSFWLEWRLWGTNTTGYHVTNLLLHLAAVFLIWKILRTLAIPGAFLAALLFAVHPVNVESVSWISQRKNTLAMVFFLLSILWYLRAEERRETRGEGRGSGIWYWMSLVAFLLAMLSKGSVAVLPVLLLLIVWWRRKRIDAWDLLRTVPFFLIAGALAYVNVWFQKHGLDIVVRQRGFFAAAGRGRGGGMVLPGQGAGAGVFGVHLSELEYRSARAVVVAAAGSGAHANCDFGAASDAAQHRLARALLFAWLFFCAALVPVLGFTDVGFMQYSLVADHYEHIAIIAVAALAAAGWSLLVPAIARCACAGYRSWESSSVTGALAFLTWQQNQLYRGPLPLCEATLEQNPSCWPLHNDVGVALRKRGRTQEAIGHYQQALRLNPNFADAHYNFGNLLLQLGQTQSAIDQYQQAVRLNPDNASAHDNLGSALAQVGRQREAIKHFERSLRIKPESPITHNNLANVLDALGQSKEAIAHYQEALRLKPDYAEAHNNLGMALLETDRPEATEQFQEALRLAPQYADAHNNLAGVLLDNGQVSEAIEHYRQALSLKPNYAEAYSNLARAYAEMNERDAAIATAEKGLELARSQGQMPLAEQIESWLAEYRSQKNGLQKPAPQPGAVRTAP